MRYLGRVAELSKLKHVKDICITEMLARSLKRIFNAAVSWMIIRHQDRKRECEEELREIEDQVNLLENPPYLPLYADAGRMHSKSTPAVDKKVEQKLSELAERKR